MYLADGFGHLLRLDPGKKIRDSTPFFFLFSLCWLIFFFLVEWEMSTNRRTESRKTERHTHTVFFLANSSVPTKTVKVECVDIAAGFSLFFSPMGIYSPVCNTGWVATFCLLRKKKWRTFSVVLMLSWWFVLDEIDIGMTAIEKYVGNDMCMSQTMDCEERNLAKDSFLGVPVLLFSLTPLIFLSIFRFSAPFSQFSKF